MPTFGPETKRSHFTRHGVQLPLQAACLLYPGIELVLCVGQHSACRVQLIACICQSTALQVRVLHWCVWNSICCTTHCPSLDIKQPPFRRANKLLRAATRQQNAPSNCRCRPRISVMVRVSSCAFSRNRSPWAACVALMSSSWSHCHAPQAQLASSQPGCKMSMSSAVKYLIQQCKR